MSSRDSEASTGQPKQQEAGPNPPGKLLLEEEEEALGRQGREPPHWVPYARTPFPPWLAKGLMQLHGPF